MLLNVAFINFPLGFLYVTLIGGLFPGTKVWLAWLLCIVIALPHLLTYGLFASAMPRSGGDYLFISRALHPLWGFIVNSTFTLFQIFSTAFIVHFVPLFALPALFQSLAIITGDSGWASAANSVSTNNAKFLIAGGLILFMGVLAMFRVRLLMQAFNILMILTLVGVVLTIGALLFTDRDTFATGFSEFGSVSQVVTDAKEAGFADSGFKLSASLASITLLFGALGFAHISTYFAGEIRRPTRSMIPSVIGAVAVTGAGFAVVAYLAERAFGQSFLNSAQFLADATDKWPVNGAPFVNLFIGIAHPNTLLVVLLGAGTVAGVWALGVPTFLMSTRNLFAHAFDRVLPAPLASVDDRTHTPVVGTIVVTALMLLFLAGFVYSSSQFTLYLAMSSVVGYTTFASVGVAAMLFPYRRRAMYENSSIRRDLFGLPLISVIGAVDALVMVVYLILLFANESTGARSTSGLVVVGIIFALMAAIWVVAWTRLRGQGIDLTLVQEELPPE